MPAARQVRGEAGRGAHRARGPPVEQAVEVRVARGVLRLARQLHGQVLPGRARGAARARGVPRRASAHPAKHGHGLQAGACLRRTLRRTARGWCKTQRTLAQCDTEDCTEAARCRFPLQLQGGRLATSKAWLSWTKATGLARTWCSTPRAPRSTSTARAARSCTADPGTRASCPPRWRQRQTRLRPQCFPFTPNRADATKQVSRALHGRIRISQFGPPQPQALTAGKAGPSQTQLAVPATVCPWSLHSDGGARHKRLVSEVALRNIAHAQPRLVYLTPQGRQRRSLCALTPVCCCEEACQSNAQRPALGPCRPATATSGAHCGGTSTSSQLRGSPAALSPAFTRDAKLSGYSGP